MNTNSRNDERIIRRMKRQINEILQSKNYHTVIENLNNYCKKYNYNFDMETFNTEDEFYLLYNEDISDYQFSISLTNFDLVIYNLNDYSMSEYVG